ncbi:ABC transporter permease [Streptococcus sp. S784/96/1]|uniref:ABC transporter permease n=1 Tax=Streptococcus sp. S784/96/1 TaxID=2653499 RepID=UPI001386F0DC|nr:ABC transporter permease [Streptococcus sp. S784/96/1]
MKKYLFTRTLRSLFSIFMVIVITYTVVYTLVPTRLIFNQDPLYNKMSTTPDKKDNYVNTVFERMGYIQYYNTKELVNKAKTVDSSVTSEATKANQKIYEDYIKSIGNGWELHHFKESGQAYATRKIPIYERLWNFFSNLVVIDHPWKVKDKDNPNLERYIRVENDPAIGWSVVGSGTEHKYLLYVNNQFPYIHQNFITFNLGNSYPTFSGIPVLQVITQGQGKALTQDVTFPTGVTKKSSVDIYSRTYQNPSKADDLAIANFGKGDNYTATKVRYTDPSMIANSARIGLTGIFIAYVLGLPLGLFMARFKSTWFDSMSTSLMTFILAVPSIALIYVIRFIGGYLGLPDNFPLLGASDMRSYLLPSIVLGLLSVPGLAIWFRRYLVDLQNSDWMRFARAKGLSEGEIYRSHLFKNAMVPVVHGIPGAIVLTIAGATLTETVFIVPGMGKMLIDSIRASNNAMVVGLTFIFTTLSIFSLFAGDLLMALVDPRIKLSTKKGGK